MTQRCGLVLMALLSLSADVNAQPAGVPSPCRIEPYRGASSVQGAHAKVRMVNTGQACIFKNYGIPDERAHPAHSGRITQQAGNGKAEFAAPAALYTPTPGFAGMDSFEFEAEAVGRSGAALRLKVRVSIEVVAP